MRKPEKFSKNPADFAAIAGETSIGNLGIVTPDGYPRVVPVNFAVIGETVYFHGAGVGEKFETFVAGPRVTFSIAIEYALIPSYWRAHGYACPATTLYKSLLIRGRGRIVVDPKEQAEGLQALMEKHQPEGEFTAITHEEPLYTKVLKETTVFCVDPERIDIKMNFGQALPEKQRLILIQRLEERNQGRDLAAATEIRKTFETSES